MAGADRFSDFLLRVRAGDEVAAAQLVKQYQPLICRVIQKRLQQSGLSRICDSMDISQSVFGNFFARVSHGGFELQSPADVGKLLVTMAQNVLRDHQRHFKGERNRTKGDNTKCLQNALTPGSDGSPLGQTLVNRELAQRIRDAMSDEEWRLATAWASGRSWPEIAAEWGAKPNALRMKLSRALARTRHDLQGRTHDEAARELGRPLGSLSRLLGRGRKLLRARLEARGVALCAGMPETLLASGSVTLPPALVLTTVKAALDFAAGSAGSISSQAAVLAHGFLRSMLLSKAKVVSVSLLAMTFVATAAGMVASQIVKGPVPNQANGDDGKTAALACQANLDAFSYYKCRFTITLANAASSEDALAGKYTKSRPYEHLLVVDGGKEKLETLADIQPQVDKRRIQWQDNLGFTQAHWVPLAYLRKGDKALNYTSPLKVASLHGEETPAVLTEYLPLSMAVMGPKREYAPGALLKEYSDGPLSIAKTAHVQIHNRAVIELAFADKGKTVYRFFLDPQQGYLPKEAIRYAPKQTKEEVVHAYLLEAKECSRNHWFPMHTVRLLLPSRKPVSVVDIRVTELEVDKRPAASDFAITIPAGTAIMNARQDRQLFYLKQQEEMNPDDIPRLFQMLEDAPKQPLMDTAVHPPGWSNQSYALAGSAVGLLLVGGALWRWHRRHRAEIRRSDL